MILYSISQINFSNIRCRLITGANEAPDGPYYIFDYMVDDGTEYEKLAFEIEIYAYSGEIFYWSSDDPGEGNG